jgi:ABC-type branched-subunit amino acid transport system substrate-binding protein
MSASPPIAIEQRTLSKVCFVPLADLCVSITFSSACTKARHRFIVVVFAVFAVGLGYPAQADILMGAAGSMTGRDLGDQMERGAELAVADINAAGGALGQRVQLVIADDFYGPEQGVAAWPRRCTGDRGRQLPC